MQLSRKQAKKVRNKLKKMSLPEVAAQLGVSEAELVGFCHDEHILVNRAISDTSDTAPDQQDSASFTWKTWFMSNKVTVLLLSGLVAATYIYTLNYAFLSDDISGIVNQNLSNFSLVTSNPWAFGRNLIYFLTNVFFGKSPAMFRLTNVLSHLTVVLSVYVLLSLLANKRAAIFAAVLISVHPLLSEPIVWISGGGYTTYTALCLLSFIFFILRGNSRKYYFLSLGCFLLGLFVSEKAVIFSGILFAYVFLFEDLRRSWKQLIPFFTISAVWALQLIGLISVRRTELVTTFSGASKPVHPITQIPISISEYVYLLLWPDKLTLYHSEMKFSFFNYLARIATTLAFIGATVYSGAVGMLRYPWLKHVCFWLCVYIISLLPALASPGVAWIVAERYAYFGAVGLLIAVAILIEKWSRTIKRPDIAILVLGIISIALFARTVIRNFDWQDQDHLWLAAERTSPNSSQNNNNLGDLYSRRKDFDRAITYFTRATQLEPCYGDAYHNLANTYLQLGQADNAIRYYNKAIECKPILWQSHVHLASIYRQLGDKENALSEIDAAIKLNPNDNLLKQNREIIEKDQY